MNMVSIIKKKISGAELTQEEMHSFISCLQKQTISDDEIRTLLLAFSVKGMSDNEIYNLAMEIALSGTMFELRKDFPVILDKHSIGGFTDPATVVLIPILMALDFPVIKISSSGYGEYARTLDRFRVFQGFHSSFTKKQIILQ